MQLATLKEKYLGIQEDIEKENKNREDDSK